VSWTPDELVAFVGRVLYEVVERGLTLDYAFQRVKRGWRRLGSFKVFYDVSFDAVKHYFLLRYLAARLLGSSGARPWRGLGLYTGLMPSCITEIWWRGIGKGF
jgi:hypothetical protein